MFPPESWEAERAARYEIGPLQRSFHRSVPSLGWLNWTIEDISRGQAQTRLPLNVESSNQYITQQAALMLLAADYTGGLALATLFKETPVIGLHSQRNSYGAYLWGASASIKWLRPSTSDLILRASIPERDWDGISKVFESGEEVVHKVRIKMFSDDNRLTAVSDFTYWGRSSSGLRSTGKVLKTTHHMLTHQICTSARLIAGLRHGIVNEQMDRLDPFAAKAAGAQGLTMARKFSDDTPQLPNLVKARTLAGDAQITDFAKDHPEFVLVSIGCGLDARPWRMTHLGGARFVELDLPLMLREREAALPLMESSPYPIVRSTFDLTSDDLLDILNKCNVPHDLPKFFIWEGGSMYFSEEEARRLLRMIQSSMCSRSRLWVDCTTNETILDQTEESEVFAFMENMRMIGEPFVLGLADFPFESVGLSIVNSSTAADVLQEANPVLQRYLFLTLTV